MRKRMTSAFVAATLALLLGVPAQANDEQIGQQIVQRLQQQRQAAQLEGFNIGVQVENGTVTMSGSVSGEPQAMLALDVARRVPGVKLVINDLRVTAVARPAGDAGPAGGLHHNGGRAGGSGRVDAAVSARSGTHNPPRPCGLPSAVDRCPGAGPHGPAWQATIDARPLVPRPPSAATGRPPQPLAFARGTLPTGRRPVPASHPGLRPVQHVAGVRQWTTREGIRAVTGRDGRHGAGTDLVHDRRSLRGNTGLRQPADAGLCVAQLCVLSELRGPDLPASIFADGVALHRPVLSLPPGAAGLAQGDVGVG